MPSEDTPVAQALKELPQRRPASLYDVAVQYSVFDWYDTVTSEDLDFELDPEHLAFMTPMEKNDLYGEPDNALVVYVDLSGDHPKFRDKNPVQFETVDAGQRFKLGHSYPQDKTNMTDYSITTHKQGSEFYISGQRDDAYVKGTIEDRFTRWAHSEAADRVLDRNDLEDGWILESLREIGNNDKVFEKLRSRDDFPLDPDDEDTEHEVFITIRVRLEKEGPYHWPGEIGVLNEVMVEQKVNRLENTSVTDAGGDGVGYVTGEEGHVTGGSPGLLGMYTKLQREHFPDLSVDGSNAWRNRPIHQEIAAAIATANSVFEEFYQGLGNRRRLYVLPYLGAHPDTIDPETFDRFVTDVFDPLRDAPVDRFDTSVGSVFYHREEEDASSEDTESLSLFGSEDSGIYGRVRVATVFTVTGEPDRVFFETTNADVYRPRAVDQAHGDVLRSPVFQGAGIFRAGHQRSDSPLLTPSASLSEMALFGGYFEWTTEPTRSSEESAETPKAGDIDDIRARRLRQFLTGEEIPVPTLLEEYVHLLVQRQRDQFGDDSGIPVPGRQALEQYAQLRALNDIRALGPWPQQGLQTTPQTNENTDSNFPAVTDTTSEPLYASREKRLEEFIESHDVLEGSPSRQSAFLLGGLVGRISSYQRRQDVSSTLVRRYPIDYLTKQSIKEVTNEVLQMNNTYVESDDELPSTYNARYTNRLPDLMLSSDPSSWSLQQSELQWLYALGITYGMNDTQLDTEE